MSDFLKFAEYGNGYIPVNNQDALVDLPVGSYRVGFNDQTGTFYLQPTATPSRPKKVYGDDVTARSARFFEWFKTHTDQTTGVLLIGAPGSGKTLLMNEIFNRAIESGVSVLLIDRPFAGGNFNDFIHGALKNIPLVVGIDEFEKQYDFNDNSVLAPMLSMFQGAHSSHKMFVCTANDRHQIADPFFNRPGRFRYVCEFGRLSDSVVESYLADNLNNQNLTADLAMRLINLSKLNFDILSAITNEVNVTNNVAAAFQDLNILDKYSASESWSIFDVRNHEGKSLQFNFDSNFCPTEESTRLTFNCTKQQFVEQESFMTRYALTGNRKNRDREDNERDEYREIWMSVDRNYKPTKRGKNQVFRFIPNEFALSGMTAPEEFQVFVEVASNSSRSDYF